jgi:hypothetical protein
MGDGATRSSLSTRSSLVALLMPRLRLLGRSLLMLGKFCAYLIILWRGCGGTVIRFKSIGICPGRRQEVVGDCFDVTRTKKGGRC